MHVILPRPGHTSRSDRPPRRRPSGRTSGGPNQEANSLTAGLSHIIEFSLSVLAERHFKSSEGVRIFTVNRESGSSLKSKTKPVCTRSSRSRIAQAVLLSSLAVLTGPALMAQTATAPTAEQGVQTLCQPEVIGNRRIPKESVLARLFSHQNDLYDPAVVERDFNSLWNTGYFDNVRIERVDTPKCVQLVIYVKEKPTIKDVEYKGLSSNS
jgi:outer membrane protein insertion porin family